MWRKRPGVAARPKKKKRGPLARRKQSHARAARPRRIKRPPERQSRLNETKCPEVTAKPRMPQRALPSGRPLSRSRLLPSPPPRPIDEGKLVYLKLSELHAFHTFRDHPFQVKDDEKMVELVGTIKEHGVMTPATAATVEVSWPGWRSSPVSSAA